MLQRCQGRKDFHIQLGVRKLDHIIKMFVPEIHHSHKHLSLRTTAITVLASGGGEGCFSPVSLSGPSVDT